MPNIGERERQLQKAINRWENEGGAIATNERPRITDDGKAAQRATHLPSKTSRMKVCRLIGKSIAPE
jgi:hypothetical protein